ncbi:MAG: TatD family hydrolase [Bacteroidota bacterium]|nr:TatD family hydrolase [Bacteroidota bacterium]
MQTFLDLSSVEFIDIHTHSPSNRRGVFSLQSLFLKDAENAPLNFFSCGVHPWYVSESYPSTKFYQSPVFKRKELIAVGEIGLDKVNNKVNYNLQIEVFKTQLILAEQLKKPVIIHSVKAYSDVLAILKKTQPTVPLIFHGYNENMQIADQLLNFNSYFSFGQFLFRTNSKAVNVFSQIPENKLFLETDDSLFSISEVYEKATEIRSLKLNDLQGLIADNFRKVFAIND